MWIDTHCHLNAPEFASDVDAVREQARRAGVVCCVIPAVQASEFAATRDLAQRLGDAYALGIHPLYVADAPDQALEQLDAALTASASDPRLVAIGEIGLDYFVPELTREPLRVRQEHFCREQLKLARLHGLPVLLHVRRSADQLLHMLRHIETPGGIAHAFNGSAQQAWQFIGLGFKLGLGGTCTYERATRLRALAQSLPLGTIVLETDAPDMPPRWRYTPAAARSTGAPPSRNTPDELPRIGAEIANLRGMSAHDLAQATAVSAKQALPKLGVLIDDSCHGHSLTQT
ncbi:MAG: TatD family hydrolase [Burkholderiaceae bacterium]|nr:TatD family hydrolase [Burkholderiaceae bacterium]